MLALWALLALAPAPARAQVSLPAEFDPFVDRHLILDEQIANARWSVGKVRLDPWIRLQDFGAARTNASPGSPDPSVDDVRGRVAAGVTALLPIGQKAFATAQLLPEYLWWNELEERRRAVANYGAGFYGYFNHVTVEAEGARTWTETIPSPEIDTFVQERRDEASLRAGLRLTGRLSVVAHGAYDRYQVPEIEEEGLRRRLARREAAAEAGLRFDVTGRSRLTVALQHGALERDDPTCACDNRRSDALVRLEHSGGKLVGEVVAAWRSLTPQSSPERPRFDGLVGRFAARYTPHGRTSFSIYGHQDVTDALSPTFVHLHQGRLGLTVETLVGWRTRPRLLVELGNDVFTAAQPGEGRRDVMRAFGARVGVSLGHSTETAVELVHTSYSGDEERSSTVLSWTFSLGGSVSSR